MRTKKQGMDLVIDIGNTLHKIAVFDKENIVFSCQYEKLEAEELTSVLNTYPISRSILSSVTENYEELAAILESRSEYIRYDRNVLLPISIDYETGHTLGPDRIANAVAANSRFPSQNVLSVQSGTCLVYDFIDERGVYQGGAISPGLEMRFKALHHFTHKLPLVTLKEIDHFIGRSTQQSMESGVINGVIHEINGFITQYENQYPGIRVLLSGGDSGYLQKSIKNAIFVGSNFILFGLHEILKLNAHQE